MRRHLLKPIRLFSQHYLMCAKKTLAGEAAGLIEGKGSRVERLRRTSQIVVALLNGIAFIGFFHWLNTQRVPPRMNL